MCLDLSQASTVTEVDLVLPAKQDVSVYLANELLRAGAQLVGSARGRRARSRSRPTRSSSPARP